MRAPSPANRKAIDRPRPVPPPVRNTARPFNKSLLNTFHHLSQGTDRASAILVYSRLCADDLFETRLGVGWKARKQALRTQLRWNGPAHRFRILGGVQGTFGKFIAQFTQQFLRQGILFFSASRQSQQALGKRLQIASPRNCFSDLLHAKFLVAVDSPKLEKESRTTRKASNDVIGGAHQDIRMVRVGVIC